MMPKTTKKSKKSTKPVYFDKDDFITPTGRAELRRKIKVLREGVYDLENFLESSDWGGIIRAELDSIAYHFCL